MARRLLALSVAACALALPSASASAATCEGADATISPLTIGSAREAVLCMVNAERTARGLNALRTDSLLELAAQTHSEDMLLRSFFDHVNPDGANPGDRLIAARYDWTSYGENIAAGYTTPRRVMLGWMGSEGHCHNVLSPAFTQLGVGITALAATLPGGIGTWTQDFGRPMGTPAPGGDRAPQQGCPYASLEGVDGTVAAPAAAGPDASTGSEAGTGTGRGVDGGSPAADSGQSGTPAGRTPAPDDVPAEDGEQPLALGGIERAGSLLTLAGSTGATGVRRLRVTVKRRGHVLLRRTVRVRNGRYHLRLKGLPRHGRVTLIVTGPGLRVVRSIR